MAQPEHDVPPRQSALAHFDEFLNFFAHELRNELAPISSGVQVMELLGSDFPDELLRARDLISKQLSHVLGLLSNVLELTRISRQKITLQREPVDVARLFAEAFEEYRSLSSERGVEFRSTLETEKLWTSADRGRLAQAVFALVDFATHIADAGSPVTVAASRPAGQIDVSMRIKSGTLSQEDLAALFDCFGATGFPRNYGGIALALTLARRSVELHGGRIDPKREASLIVLSLHLPAATETSATPSPSKPSATAGPCRMLIIDDNREACDMLARLAAALGHEVKTAYTGAAGISAAKTFAPQIILLDLQLPDINGVEVARQIRLSKIERPLIAALTGNDSDDDRRRCVQAGFDQFFVKPVRLDDLRRLAASVCVMTNDE